LSVRSRDSAQGGATSKVALDHSLVAIATFYDERSSMPQISTEEFRRLPLRVHDFLADVPLHDVWAVDLPHPRAGITLNDFWRMGNTHTCKLPPLAGALVNIRLFAGRLLGWDRPPATDWEAFATRLTTADRSKSLVPPGTPEGLFRTVYRFENEQLLELPNRTAHAAALSALVDTSTAYRFYFGVYVRNVSRFTPLYMWLIDPFRKHVVYPSILRAISATWATTFGTPDAGRHNPPMS
jgi:hypothetical protein